ncbi:MAG: serine/threonine-protein kinase [Deltaproteobacteria bacterium]
MTDERDADSTVIESLDPWLGLVLHERYRITQKIAAGGFGVVYVAADLVAQRDVAIKLLHPGLAADPSIAARFRREIEALQTLKSPHTVAALDAGEAPDGTPFLVMELLTGESVYEQMKARGKMPWRRVLAIARGVCHSLGEAHARGIVHRDLKPENIHLERRGDDLDFVKVLDFGIAKNHHSAIEGGADLTQVGQMIGTFCYMAPEQMIGSCTPESDVFTLGVVVYELIAGRRPYGDAKGPAAQLAAVLGDPPPSLPHAPAALVEIVMRCIDKDPLRRYRDAHELGEALATIFETGDDTPTVYANKRYQTPPPTPVHHGDRIATPAKVWFEPALGTATIHGIVPARGSGTTLEPDQRPRLASGTSPVVDLTNTPFALPEPSPETPKTGTGMSSYAATNWNAVVIALVIAMLVITITFLL